MEKNFFDQFDGAKPSSGASSGNFFDQFDGPPKQEDSGDFVRGAKVALGQTPALAKGAVGLLGSTLEKAVGEGGYATKLKDWGLSGYQEGMQKLAPLQHENDDVTVAWSRAKDGDLGALVDWAQYALGYGVAQMAETAVVGVGGALAGGAMGGGVGAAPGALAGVVEKEAAKGVIRQAVEREIARRAGTNASEAAVQAATKSLARDVGAVTALTGYNVGVEAGSIYPEAVEQAKKDGRQMTGSDLARIWGAAALAGASETIPDMIGLGVVTGRLRNLIPGNSKAVRVGAGAVGGAGLEAGQEAFQTGVERWGAQQPLTGDEATRDYINSAAMAALPGAIVGGGSGLLHSRAQPAVPPAPAPLEAPVSAPLGLPAPTYTGGMQTDLEAVRRATEANDAAARLYAERDAEEARANHAFEQLGLARTVDDVISAAMVAAGPTFMSDVHASVILGQGGLLDSREEIAPASARESDFVHAQRQVEEQKQRQLAEMQSGARNSQADAAIAESVRRDEDRQPQTAMQAAFGKLLLRRMEALDGKPAEVRLFGKPLDQVSDEELAHASEKHPMSGFRHAAQTEIARRKQEAANAVQEQGSAPSSVQRSAGQGNEAASATVGLGNAQPQQAPGASAPAAAAPGPAVLQEAQVAPQPAPVAPPQPVAPVPAAPPQPAKPLTFMGKPLDELNERSLTAASKRARTTEIRQAAQAELDRRHRESRIDVPHDTHEMLRIMADNSDWIERGGEAIGAKNAFDETLGIRSRNEMSDRTHWVGKPDWAKAAQGANMTKAEIKGAVEKAIAGKPLGPKQKTMVEVMLDEIAETRAVLAEVPAEEHADVIAAVQNEPVPDAWSTMSEHEKDAYLDALPWEALPEGQSRGAQAAEEEVRPAQPGEREPGSDDEVVTPALPAPKQGARPALDLAAQSPQDLKAKEAQAQTGTVEERAAAVRDRNTAILAAPEGTAPARSVEEQKVPTQQGGLKFSRSAGSSTGIDRATFRKALASAFGEKAAARLLDEGVVNPVEHQGELPGSAVPLMREGDRVFGFYDPASDRTYAVLENLSAADVKGLALHEVGIHYGFEKMLGPTKYDQVMRRLDLLRRAGNKNVQAAHETATKEAADPDQVAEETLAYLVQRHPAMSIVQEIVASVKAFLYREFGIGAASLTEADLAMLARAAVMKAGLKGEASQLAPAMARTGSENMNRLELAKRRMGEMVNLWEKGQLKPEMTTHLGETSWALQLLGAPAKNLYVGGSMLSKVLGGKHGHQITPDMVRQIPEQLLEPMMVFDAEDPGARAMGALVVVTELTDRTGKPIVVPIHVDVNQGRLVANEIASVYGRHDGVEQLQKWADKGLLRYYDQAKTANPSTTLRLSPEDLGRLPHVVQAGKAANPNVRSDEDVVKQRGAMFSRAGWIDRESPATQEALRKAGVWYAPPTLKDRIDVWKKDWAKRVRQGLVDQFDPIKEYDYKAYLLARMTRSADAALEAMLHYGTVKLDNDGAIDVNFEKGGFLKILQGLKGEHERFLAWVIGNRAARLAAEDREHNFTSADIANLKALADGKMKDGNSRRQAFEEARVALDRYNKSVLDVAERTGLIDGASRSAWEKDFYVPFYRLMEAEAGKPMPVMTKGLVNQYAFKVLKGGEKALGDPLENILKNWSHLIDASLKNQAAKASLLAGARVGAVVEADEATAKQMAKSIDKSRGAVSFVDQGTQRWFVVEDAFLLDAMRSIGYTGSDQTAVKIMGQFKKWLTMGVTVSPTFRIRNVIRDSLQMIGTNPASYNVLDNLLTGWKATKEGTPEYASLLAGGGVMRFGTLLEGDRAAHVKQLIDAGVPSDTILNTPARAKAMLREAWDWWQHVGDRAENINRAALYKKLRADGKSHLEASFAARDSMDFSMQGTWGAIRFLSQTVPFFNARLQGLYKLGRGAAEDPRRFGIVVGAATLAGLALFLAYKDDEDWKAREDWDRETFWWFKVGGKAFRIPKPFEIGAIATLAERGLEAMSTDELTGKQFASRVYNILSQQLSLNPVPQLATPLIEIYANRSSFTDRPIETMGMERLSKAERIGANTSPTAQLLGKNGLVSPVQIDHLVRGYFGWLGAHVVSTADLALRPAMGLPPQPAYKIDDVLVAGDFVKDLPAYQSKYVTRLYDQMKEVQEAMADFKHLQQIGATEKAHALLEDKKDKIQLYRLYTHAQQQLTKVNHQIQVVQARGGDAEQKRERLDQLYEMRNRIAEITELRARSATAARAQ